MVTTVFLVRHGLHDQVGNRLCGRMDGVRLNGEGHRQSTRLGKRLAWERLDAIYASPRQRTVETAQSIARETGALMQTEPAIDEIDLGSWTGASLSELGADPLWKAWNGRRSLMRPPGGEAMWEVQARVLRFIEGFVYGSDDRRICLVSHGDVIKAVLCHGLGLPIDLHDRFEVSPGSVSVLVMGCWGIKVHALNEVPYND